VPTAVTAAPLDAAALTTAARSLAAELPQPALVTDFEAFAFLAARAAAGHDRIRARRIGEDRLRVHHRVNLGIAVTTASGDLVVAAVPGADQLPFAEFAATCRQRVEAARQGTATVDGTVTLVLSHLDDGLVTFAVPVVVPPAVATLFMGATDGAVRQAVMAFDHTVLNGVDAARFLAAVRDAVAARAAAAPEPPAPIPPASPAAPRPAPPRERLARVVAVVQEVVGRAVDPDVPLGELGLTSAGALELVEQLNAAFAVDLPATAVWRYPTARSLATALGAHGTGGGT
jgi:acyl carrier protein